MCVVSMIADHYRDRFKDPLDEWKRMSPSPVLPMPGINYPLPNHPKDHSAELEQLRKEVLDMKELLKKAIKYDADNNEPHCEQEEKIAVLRKVAEAVGVNLDDVFGGKGDAT